MTDSLILIAVENKVNAQLLQDILKQYHNVRILEAEANAIYPFDLGIFDGVNLNRFQDQILTRKDVDHDIFLPTLLITTRQDLSLATRQLWKSVDEVIFSPIEKIELLARVEVLLRAHNSSVELALLYKGAHEQGTFDERQRLARELHDSVTQMIYSASTLAQTLPNLQARDPERARVQLEEVVQLNRSALAEMRSLLLEQRPGNLARSDIKDLLEQLAISMQGRRTISITSEVEGVSILPEVIHLGLYRIAQEALNNVIKHSQATEAHIELRAQNGQLILRIHDNGAGFDSGLQTAGIGLEGMSERAALIGATINITSQKGDGTDIIVSMPISQALSARS